MEPTSDSPNVEQLVDGLKAQIEERERQGLYPADLAHDLQAHFRRIASQRSLPDLEELHERLGALEALSDFSAARIPLTSANPAGARLHALIARVVARQTEGVLAQMRDFAHGVQAVLESMAEALEQPHGHVHTDLVGQVDALFEQVAAFERGGTDDLRRRIEALEAATRSDTT
jgi:hydrogenase maturation factor HypE